MKPVRTTVSDVNYRGSSDDVGDLWVQRIKPGHIEAVWEPDEAERELLAAGGRVVVGFACEPIPPSYVRIAAVDEHQLEGHNAYRNRFPDLPDPRA